MLRAPLLLASVTALALAAGCGGDDGEERAAAPAARTTATTTVATTTAAAAPAATQTTPTPPAPPASWPSAKVAGPDVTVSWPEDWVRARTPRKRLRWEVLGPGGETCWLSKAGPRTGSILITSEMLGKLLRKELGHMTEPRLTQVDGEDVAVLEAQDRRRRTVIATAHFATEDEEWLLLCRAPDAEGFARSRADMERVLGSLRFAGA